MPYVRPTPPSVSPALRKNRNQFLENVHLEKPKRNITHCNGKSIKIITRPVDPSEQANIFQVPFQILLGVLYVSVQKNKKKQSEKNVSTKIKPTTANKMKNAGKNIAAK